MKRIQSQDQGYAPLLIIAILLFTTTGVIFNSHLLLNSKNQELMKISESLEMVMVRNHIVSLMNCQATLSHLGLACPQQTVGLYGIPTESGMKELVGSKKAKTQIGKFLVTANCTTDDGSDEIGFIVKVKPRKFPKRSWKLLIDSDRLKCWWHRGMRKHFEKISS
jgi:hypothetical protein